MVVNKTKEQNAQNLDALGSSFSLMDTQMPWMWLSPVFKLLIKCSGLPIQSLGCCYKRARGEYILENVNKDKRFRYILQYSQEQQNPASPVPVF